MHQGWILQLYALECKEMESDRTFQTLNICDSCLGYASIALRTNIMFSLQKLFAQPISRDLRRELYSRQRGDGVPKRKSRKEALQKKLLQAKELQAKEGNKENQKAAPTQPVDTKSSVVVKKIVKS